METAPTYAEALERLDVADYVGFPIHVATTGGMAYNGILMAVDDEHLYVTRGDCKDAMQDKIKRAFVSCAKPRLLPHQAIK